MTSLPASATGPAPVTAFVSPPWNHVRDAVNASLHTAHACAFPVERSPPPHVQFMIWRSTGRGFGCRSWRVFVVPLSRQGEAQSGQAVPDARRVAADQGKYRAKCSAGQRDGGLTAWLWCHVLAFRNRRRRRIHRWPLEGPHGCLDRPSSSGPQISHTGPQARADPTQAEAEAETHPFLYFQAEAGSPLGLKPPCISCRSRAYSSAWSSVPNTSPPSHRPPARESCRIPCYAARMAVCRPATGAVAER